MDDTIVAISTALGEGAISIIRMSGNEAVTILKKVFKHKNLDSIKSHTIYYGYIVDGEDIIDEVLVSIMLKPKTYTREDVVEINAHGGITTTNKILEVLIKNGARLALAGEFTKRAFLNGRIDLIQADSINNLIETKSDAGRKVFINGLSGKTSSLIRSLRDELVTILGNIEVNIDYPEYTDIEEITNEKFKCSLNLFADKLKTIIKNSENGMVLTSSIKVGIIGRPNVGKSSLLNALLEEDKAIVTDIPGTTRDIVEGSINLDGIILNVIDTAGIRNTDDVVEKIGVSKSLSIIDNSDLIILILNNNDYIDKDDLELLDKTKDMKRIIVVNKIDLDNKLDKNMLDDYIEISVKEDIGIDLIKDKIKNLFNLGEINLNNDCILTNIKNIGFIKKALDKINNAINNIDNDLPIDMVEFDVRSSWEILGEIIGETYSEEFLDNLFSKFCLGK